MSAIRDLVDLVKGFIGAILGIGLVLEVLMPGVAASVVILIGFFMLIFSSKRMVGFLLMIFASLWMYVVDYSIILKFYDGIGLINLNQIVSEANLGGGSYKADYVKKIFMVGENGASRRFRPDEKFYVCVEWNWKKGYVNNRSYPEDNIIVYIVQKEKKNKDPYTQKQEWELTRWEDRAGFYYPYDSQKFIWAADYGILEYDPNKPNCWKIKEGEQYLGPGTWELYLFMMRPGTLPFGERHAIEDEGILDIFDMTTVVFKNRKRFYGDEFAAKITFKIK